jgi:hypothetical protein
LPHQVGQDCIQDCILRADEIGAWSFYIFHQKCFDSEEAAPLTPAPI